VTIRARLVIAFTVLLLVVIAGLGIVMVRSTRAALTEQIDDQLAEIQHRAYEEHGRRGRGFPGDLLEADPSGREVALVIMTGDGATALAVPSGYYDEPDPLPDAKGFLGDSEHGITTIGSTEGSLSYRAVSLPLTDGGVEVWAVPLDEVEEAVGGLLGTLLLAGAGVLLLGAAATWWTVRKGLQPVDRMVETATAIADGDLSSRVPDTEPNTELGRLGGALNDMLGQIEDAFDAERDAQDRLRLFIADASHELRTPISAIQGYAELYRKGALDDREDLNNAMRRVGTESARMERLVGDLLLLARLDREQPRDHRSVDLYAVVRDAVADSNAIEPDRSIELNGAGPAMVMGDEQQLTQVVANLLANARTHTPQGAPVGVNVAKENGRVRLTVLDNGPGLPDEHLPHVFDRFYRADSSRARRTGGTGLGLAIVAAIVSAHEGTVAVASEPGRGAQFTVTLPGVTKTSANTTPGTGERTRRDEPIVASGSAHPVS
jgi:two-component system OmpR family sensor kinase